MKKTKTSTRKKPVQRYFRRHPVRTQRALEILPGVFSWFWILFPIWGSFIIPKFVAYYVIIFAVYWLYRSINLAIFAFISQKRMRHNIKHDVMPQLKNKFAKGKDVRDDLVEILNVNLERKINQKIDLITSSLFPLIKSH